jgi:hypothetical protein
LTAILFFHILQPAIWLRFVAFPSPNWLRFVTLLLAELALFPSRSPSQLASFRKTIVAQAVERSCPALAGKIGFVPSFAHRQLSSAAWVITGCKDRLL